MFQESQQSRSSINASYYYYVRITLHTSTSTPCNLLCQWYFQKLCKCLLEGNILNAIYCYKFYDIKSCFSYQHICFLYHSNRNCIYNPSSSLFPLDTRKLKMKFNACTTSVCNVGKILCPIWTNFSAINLFLICYIL